MGEAHHFLADLEAIIDQRLRDAPAQSYVSRLAGQGLRKVGQKVGEEGVELALAVAAGDRSEVICEAADLLFHMLLALRMLGVDLGQVCLELESRHTTRVQGS